MAYLHAGLDAGDDAATGVSGLFRARYPEMVRLADLLGADDPEDIAQAMGTSPGTVKSNVSRGLAALAEVLGGKA